MPSCTLGDSSLAFTPTLRNISQNMLHKNLQEKTEGHWVNDSGKLSTGRTFLSLTEKMENSQEEATECEFRGKEPLPSSITSLKRVKKEPRKCSRFTNGPA